MEATAIRVGDLIDGIRRNGRGTNGHRAVGSVEVRLPPPESLRTKNELVHLNRHWVLEAELQVPPAGFMVSLRRALVPRRLRAWLKRTIAWAVLGSLEAYLLEERAFFENLVRLQNDIARRGDETAEETRALAAATEKVAHWLDRLSADAAARDEFYHAQAERRIERLERALRIGA
jgi:hypothetical protein